MIGIVILKSYRNIWNEGVKEGQRLLELHCCSHFSACFDTSLSEELENSKQ